MLSSEYKVKNIERKDLGDGGAIYISDESYTLLNNVSVYNNHASSGAGVYMFNKATMRATKSEFECNWQIKMVVLFMQMTDACAL